MAGRKDRLLDEKVQDPYMDRNLYRDPTICPTCNLVFHNKTWHQDTAMLEKYKKLDSTDYKDCPACRKIKDNYPLGILMIEGKILEDESKVEELLNLVKHEEEKEMNSNPLARIMKIERLGNGIEIGTTTMGLAKRIGKALYKARQGTLDVVFSEGEKFLRVIWKKD